MSKFSELLGEICQKRNITSESLSKLSGIERTQTYRILKGTRKPAGAEQIRQIFRVLQLSFQETEDLEKALQIDLVGIRVYERRHYLSKVFQELSFLNYFKSQVSFAVDLNREVSNPENIAFIQGKQELGNALQMMINQEEAKKNGEINLLLNPASGLFDANNIFALQKNSDLRIRHLLLFDNGQDNEKDIINLQILFSLIPILVKNKGYEPRVCYEKLEAIASKAIVFPYYCIAGDYVLEISSDGNEGRLIRNAACGAYYHNKFMSAYSRSTLLAVARHDLKEIIDFYICINSKSQGKRSYVLEAQAGIARYVNSNNLANNLKTLPAEVESTVKDYILLERTILQNQKKKMQSGERAELFLSFFTEEGMRIFLEEGRVIQAPEVLYDPFLPNDRRDILRRLLEDAKSGHLLLRMIDENKFKLPSVFSILSTENFIGMAVYPSKTEYWTIEVEEVSTVLAVEDFLAYLGDSDFVFGQEESIRRLEKMMASSLGE